MSYLLIYQIDFVLVEGDELCTIVEDESLKILAKVGIWRLGVPRFCAN